MSNSILLNMSYFYDLFLSLKQGELASVTSSTVNYTFVWLLGSPYLMCFIASIFSINTVIYFYTLRQILYLGLFYMYRT